MTDDVLIVQSNMIAQARAVLAPTLASMCLVALVATPLRVEAGAGRYVRPLVAARASAGQRSAASVRDFVRATGRYHNIRCYSLPAFEHRLVAALVDVDPELFGLWMRSPLVAEVPLADASPGVVLANFSHDEQIFLHAALVAAPGRILHKPSALRGRPIEYADDDAGENYVGASWARRQAFVSVESFADFVARADSAEARALQARVSLLELVVSGLSVERPGDTYDDVDAFHQRMRVLRPEALALARQARGQVRASHTDDARFLWHVLELRARLLTGDSD